jgi:hypothetical protein
LVSTDFEEFQVRDSYFYHEVLALKLAKMFMKQEDYIALSEKHKKVESFEQTREIVEKVSF